MQDVLSTSEHPDPSIVLHCANPQTATHKLSRLLPFSLTVEEEEQMKFLIGLRLLGKAREARYLTFLQHLSKQNHQPEGETKNDNL